LLYFFLRGGRDKVLFRRCEGLPFFLRDVELSPGLFLCFLQRVMMCIRLPPAPGIQMQEVIALFVRVTHDLELMRLRQKLTVSIVLREACRVVVWP
jgi:hypothetical protein